MFSGVFGSLLGEKASSSQSGGDRQKPFARGSKANGAGRPFLAYEKLTVVELKVKAKKYKIKKYSDMTKAQLIAALRKK